MCISIHACIILHELYNLDHTPRKNLKAPCLFGYNLLALSSSTCPVLWFKIYIYICANLRLHQRDGIKVTQVIRNSVLISPIFISVPHPAPPSCSQFAPWPHSHAEANAYENGGCFIYVSTFTDVCRLISPSMHWPDLKFHEDRNYLLHAALHSRWPAPSLHGSVHSIIKNKYVVFFPGSWHRIYC